MGKPHFKTKKISFKKTLLLLGAAGIIAGSASVAKRVIYPGEKVLAVIDGDSFKIGRDQTIRLASLDAPETQFCFGTEAKEALTKKILGKRVLLKELKTDRFGRIMAMVYVDNELVNEYMIKNGFGLHIWDNSNQNQLLDKANNFARQNRLGIFSTECFQETPPNPKCAIKGNIIQHTNAKEYILPSCDKYSLSIIEKYKGEDWFCSEEQAKKAGFTRSPNCN